MKKCLSYIVFSALCFLCYYSASAQMDTTFKLVGVIKWNIASFEVNNLGEIYLINSDNQLMKLDNKGDSVGVFNEVTKYGRLSYIDAHNPWRTLLYYKDFLTIALLDKYLNVIGSIKLPQVNIFRAAAMATSYDNNIWVYDEQDNKLKKIDQSGTQLTETTDFSLLFDSLPSPSRIRDNDGFVYLYDPRKGVYVFDYYGSFKNRLTFLHWKDIAVNGKYIYGFDDKYFYRYTGLLNLEKYVLPDDMRSSQSIKLANGNIYVLKDNCIYIYTLR